jgi:hypothetical protein
LRIRRDAVFVSSVMFTIDLLCLVPSSLANAMAGRDRAALEALDAGYQIAAKTMGDLGVASLAIISIGLIITWAGYVKNVRWTWFVMFIIVWGWAFPLLLLPFLGHTIVPTAGKILSDALKQSGLRRDFVETIVIFALMVIALILPIKEFFLSREVSGGAGGQIRSA